MNVARTALLCAAALLAAGVARAQLGADERACRARWGEPQRVGSATNANGTRALSFLSRGVSVEVGFVDGVARRAVYRQRTWTEPGIRSVLSENSEGQEWHVWSVSGQGVSPEGSAWMRSDEMAMARFGAGELSITGGEWTRRLNARPAAATTNSLPDAGAAPVAAGQPAPEPDAVGFWRCDSPAESPVLLHIRADGTLSWFEFGDRWRRQTSGRWTRQPSNELAAFAPPDPAAAPTAMPVRLGTLRLEGPEELRFHPHPSADAWCLPALSGGPGGGVFRRIPGMPRWKPKAPAELPAAGDSKDAALRLLDKPAGAMALGGREVLVYPWGRVWIVDGTVTRVE